MVVFILLNDDNKMLHLFGGLNARVITGYDSQSTSNVLKYSHLLYVYLGIRGLIATSSVDMTIQPNPFDTEVAKKQAVIQD